MVEEAYWINIGRMLSSLKFTCYLSRSKNAKLGYRLLIGVMNPEDEIQGKPLEKLLNKKRVMYTSINDVQKIILFVEKIKTAYDINITDKSNYETVKYCLDNPPDYSSWESFIEWVEMVERDTEMDVNFID
tara:strand:+ start:121 stop:513 length:393 start_codon:yes stop_codon:yes gene_type:complete